MSQFKFSVGPWNVHPGADSYGPATRADIPAEEKYKKFAELGFSAFNQVKVLKENGYGEHGEYVGLDVKAMRTTKDEDSYKHLENSLKVFKALEEKVDRFDYEFQKKCVENRDFEALEMYVMNLLMGIE